MKDLFKTRHYNYILGLDCGISSIGYSVLKIDSSGTPTQIMDLGVRTFDAAENPKDGSSLAVERRLARGGRRRLSRRANRVLKARIFLKSVFNLNDLSDAHNKDIYELRASAIDNEITDEELYYIIINLIKHRGFKSNRKSDRKDKEMGKALLSININEAYIKSKNYRTIGQAVYNDPRFCEKTEIKDENGNIIIKRNYFIRNHNDYANSFLRLSIENEMKEILANQQKFKPLLTNEVITKILDIFNQQRSTDEGPNEPSPYRANFAVGNCTFEKDLKRAPKGSFTFEYFDILCKLNNMSYKTMDGDKIFLTQNQKDLILENLFNSSSVTYKKIRKICELKNSDSFSNLSYYPKKIKSKKKVEAEDVGNEVETDLPKTETLEEIVERVEKSDALKFKVSSEIAKALNIKLDKKNKDIIDAVGYILSMRKSDDRRLACFSLDNSKDDLLSLKEIDDKKINALKEFKFTEEILDLLLDINTEKFGNLSFSVMEKITEFLEQGEKYDKACSKAGFNFNVISGEKFEKLKYEIIKEDIRGSVTSPVAIRTISQFIKLLNAIIDKYGSPSAIFIEMAREMSLNYKDRKDIENKQKANAERNENIIRRLKEFGIINPSGNDIVKLKLYDEQGGKCIYSGIPFVQIGKEKEIFLNENTQIDHVIPYSKCFDDGYSNKVLVLASENQKKGNRLPYEYMTKEQWDNYVERVYGIYSKNIVKSRKLLKKSISEDEQLQLNERALNDTKHISKFIHGILEKYLKFDESYYSKKPVRCVNGNMTAYMRKIWGLPKDREASDTHHAQDAAVIACCTNDIIQKITRYEKFKSYKKTEDFKNRFEKIDDFYVDKTTGEKFTANEYFEWLNNWEEDFKRNNWDRVKVALPYNHFIEELKIRIKTSQLSEQDLLKLQELGYDEENLKNIKPLFVSRMPTRKVLGKIHDSTIRSGRFYNDKEGKHRVISRKSILSLSLEHKKVEKDGAIVEVVGIKDYPQEFKQRDKLLYESLLNRLIKYNGDAKEAFKDKFFKPKSNTENGPLVKKVKIQEYVSDMYKFSDNSVAGKGSMVRIDIFKKNKKFYLIPIYVGDVYKQTLPNKICVGNKSVEDWKDLTDDYEFLFTLYPNDLIYVEKYNNNDSTDEKFNKGYYYYNSCDISGAKIKIFNSDRSATYKGVGIQGLYKLEKYQVDILGNISRVKKETRQDLKFKKNK